MVFSFFLSHFIAHLIAVDSGLLIIFVRFPLPLYRGISSTNLQDWLLRIQLALTHLRLRLAHSSLLISFPKTDTFSSYEEKKELSPSAMIFKYLTPWLVSVSRNSDIIISASIACELSFQLA